MIFKFSKKLRDFTLNIDTFFDKGVLVIQGDSGSGKTTILNCISGVDTPDDGVISVKGKPLFDSKNHVNVEPKNRNIGYVFQDYALFPNMSIYKNIVYGVKSKKLEISEADIKEAMDIFRISSLKDAMPNRISGGEKQRVALLRSILTKPDLLLLDEPFSALDQNTREIVYGEFERILLNYSIPMILITHNSIEADRFGTKIIKIHKGQLIER